MPSKVLLRGERGSWSVVKVGVYSRVGGAGVVKVGIWLEVQLWLRLVYRVGVTVVVKVGV